MKFKILFVIVLFLSSFFFNINSSLAVDEFATLYDVAYDIGTDGTAQVTQKITLKNLTSQYYASNFTLSIGSTALTDIIATDGSGAMETNVETTDNKTTIKVKFNEQVAGLDKTQTFTLKFKSKDFTQAIGKTWEINLPKIPDSSTISGYNLVLSVPVSFGDPTSISPKPKSESQTYDRLFFTFNKDQLEQSGVSVNFGSTQVFDFNMKYTLNNDSLVPVLTSITLPPDTPYQEINLSRINPKPSNVTIDEDGNYLAWYELPRRSRQEITLSGSAKLYINSRDKAPVKLTTEKTRALTKTDQYWEKDNPVITSALSEIFKQGRPDTNRGKARLIYLYVVRTLKYDTDRLNNKNLERLGAVTALNNPNSAVCMEFTDLFIALARAAGVPSRELDGFAYSQNRKLRPLSLNRDLLHAWPEYYDEEKGWVMVDPTWENTSGGSDYFNKFDLNHLVFAIKGVSSTTPYISDDVKVEISPNEFSVEPRIGIEINSPDRFWSGFPASALIKVSNEGSSLQNTTILNINADTTRIVSDNSVGLAPIPPFGFTTYQFQLKTANFWESYEDTLTAEVGGQKVSKKIIVKPFFLFKPFPYILIGLAVLIFGGYGSILAFHIYQQKKIDKKQKPSEK